MSQSSPEQFDKDDYVALQSQILMFAGLVKDLRLDAFIEAINRVETVGPIVDPTLWRSGHHNMAVIKEIAVGLRDFQSVVKKKVVELEAA